MNGARILLACLAAAACIAPANARNTVDVDDAASGGGSSAISGNYLQCVPYARKLTGIGIYGDAHTWWGQAKGRYARGSAPRVGAVMNFRPHGNSPLGHVAAVSRIVDERTILIRHANWSVKGEIEDNVRAVDVSPQNDWSEVRVWYGPGQRLGATHWPLYGFIYNAAPGSQGKAKSGKRNRPVPTGFERDPIGAIIASAR